VSAADRSAACSGTPGWSPTKTTNVIISLIGSYRIFDNKPVTSANTLVTALASAARWPASGQAHSCELS